MATKIYTEFATDERIQSLSEAMQRRFVMLMCLQDQDLTDDELACALRITTDEIIATKAELFQSGLIGSNGEILAWSDMAQDRPPAHIWREIRERIFMRDDFTCQYCGERGKKLECDHIVPVARGGMHADENLATACFRCNRSKRDKLLSEWSPMP